MEQYISKSALVEKINALLDDEFQCNSYDEATGFQNALILIEKFLNTLEVKEVDLEKEVNEHWDEWAKEDGFHSIDFAKYFFELGMQVSNKSLKGE